MSVKKINPLDGISGDDKICTIQPFEVLEIIGGNETPNYTPTYVPSYTPTYTPSYTPTYSPTYTPTYVPTYVPTHVTPIYTPTYVPTPSNPPSGFFSFKWLSDFWKWLTGWFRK